MKDETFEIMAEFELNPEVSRFGFKVRLGEGEFTAIGCDVQKKKLFVDRTHSGKSDFHENYARLHLTDLIPSSGNLRLHIFVDRSSVEVFGDDGLVVFSESVFPDERSQGLEIFSEGGRTHLKTLDIYRLNPARFTAADNHL